MKLHREGIKMVWGSAAFLILFAMASVVYGNTFFRIISLLLFVWTAFVFYFFRDPERPILPKSNEINCPADGKVVIVQKSYEQEYFKDERWQISIFMSPLNVHKNMIPMTGGVIYYEYHPGKYLVAWHPKSSTKNERNTIVIKGKNNRIVLLRQIAGAVARRIVCRLKPGDQVNQGDELGFIRFGSRVDVFLPLDVEILVKPDQLVQGNVDVLARWPDTSQDEKNT